MASFDGSGNGGALEQDMDAYPSQRHARRLRTLPPRASPARHPLPRGQAGQGRYHPHAAPAARHGVARRNVMAPRSPCDRLAHPTRPVP